MKRAKRGQETKKGRKLYVISNVESIIKTWLNKKADNSENQMYVEEIEFSIM